jgi:hypothetical protein
MSRVGSTLEIAKVVLRDGHKVAFQGKVSNVKFRERSQDRNIEVCALYVTVSDDYYKFKLQRVSQSRDP